MKKKILVASLFSTLVLAACGSQPDTTGSGSSGSTKDAEAVTIKFAWWGADNRHDAMQDVVALLKRNIRISRLTQSMVRGMDGKKRH